MEIMNLKSIQAPLKERYREEPASAIITLHAEGKIGEGVTCSVDTGRALVKAGLHPATGGEFSNVCSGDLLLQALFACAGVTLNAVATSLASPCRTRRCLPRAISIFAARSPSRRSAGRLYRDPPRLRGARRPHRRPARDADQADRALLRRAAEPEAAAGHFGDRKGGLRPIDA
jgi:hypothetical protein